MGSSTSSVEFTNPVHPARLFNAYLDVANLLPKLLPQQVKSIDFIEGNGEPGSIMLTTFQDGFQLMRRVEAIDERNFYLKTSTIEAEGSYGEIEKAATEVQFMPVAGGGSITKKKAIYHTKGGHLAAQEVQADKDFFMTCHKAVEAYLLRNPNVYV